MWETQSNTKHPLVVRIHRIGDFSVWAIYRDLAVWAILEVVAVWAINRNLAARAIFKVVAVWSIYMYGELPVRVIY